MDAAYTRTQHVTVDSLCARQYLETETICNLRPAVPHLKALAANCSGAAARRARSRVAGAHTVTAVLVWVALRGSARAGKAVKNLGLWCLREGKAGCIWMLYIDATVLVWVALRDNGEA